MRNLTLLFSLCLGSSAPAADFHVSPSGNDTAGDGSAANPWKTLAHAAAATPGFNTIRLAAGTYRETAASVIKANVSVIGAGPSATFVEHAFVSPGFDFLVLLDVGFDGLPDGSVVDGNQSISGFHLIGVDHANRTRQSGIRIKGRSNVTIDNMKFSNMGNGALDIRALDGVNLATGPVNYLKGIVVRNSVFENTAQDLYANVLIGGADGAQLSGLNITEGRGVGIKAWAGGFLKNLKIDQCQINMLPPDRNRTITAGDDWPSIELTRVSDGSEISGCFLNHWISLAHSNPGGGGVNLRIHDNHFVYEAGTLQPIQIGNHGVPILEVSHNFFENIGPSYAVASWPFFGEIVDVLVHHNVFKGTGVDSKAVLFQPNNAVPGATNNTGNITLASVFNNTFVDVSDAILIQPLNGHSAQNVLIQNNIFADYASFQEPFAVVSFNTAGGTIQTPIVANNMSMSIAPDRSFAGRLPQLLAQRSGPAAHRRVAQAILRTERRSRPSMRACRFRDSPSPMA